MATDLVELARGQTRSQFLAEHAGYYLLKRPRADVALAAEPQFGFATTVTKINVDPFARQWQVFPVTKRPGNPYPERLTVGRATNCDIVLRVPFISKVHAHILLEPDGSFSLQDAESSHFTFLNHRKLAPGMARKLQVGDAIGFGSLVFEFVDGGRLYDVLRAQGSSTAPPGT